MSSHDDHGIGLKHRAIWLVSTALMWGALMECGFFVLAFGFFAFSQLNRAPVSYTFFYVLLAILAVFLCKTATYFLDMLYGSGVASVKSDDSDSIFPGIVTLLMLAAAVAFGSRVYWLVFNFASKGPPTTSGWFATYRSDVHQWNPDIIAGPFENRDACYHDDAVIGSDDAICVYLHDVPLAIIPQSDESQ